MFSPPAERWLPNWVGAVASAMRAAKNVAHGPGRDPVEDRADDQGSDASPVRFLEWRLGTCAERGDDSWGQSALQVVVQEV